MQRLRGKESEWQQQLGRLEASEGLLQAANAPLPDGWLWFSRVEGEWEHFQQLLARRVAELEKQLPVIRAQIESEDGALATKVDDATRDGERDKPLQGAMVNQLWQRRHASNEKLLSDLREDELADELLRITRDDAAKHRMTEPVLLNETSIKSCLLHPRFAVSQLKPDGKRKVRPIDNFSWGAQPEGETGRPSKKARKV